MKYIKTYGIHGLLEWHGEVRFGATKMKVDFTNGTTSAYGVAPATFTTKDELTQVIIEHSDKFKSGLIRLVDAHPIAGSEEPEPAPVVEEPAQPVTEEEPAAEPEEEAQQVVNVEVADKAEAVEWLKEHYPEKGYTAFKLRGKAAFEEACKECNVSFVFA